MPSTTCKPPRLLRFRKPLQIRYLPLVTSIALWFRAPWLRDGSILAPCAGRQPSTIAGFAEPAAVIRLSKISVSWATAWVAAVIVSVTDSDSLVNSWFRSTFAIAWSFEHLPFARSVRRPVQSTRPRAPCQEAESFGFSFRGESAKVSPLEPL